ncbi:MAG: tRNA pseudouridine(38-40) synthase TruA [Pseudomonadales bacterium]|nr:tRNA pseudouridine(38-40) synthase TruA [Pseudomonadales bacterium]
MYHHLMVISYKGSNYFGWQDLGANEQKPTIQSTIHQVLKKICKYQECKISAASRTDAGVHAQGQVAKIAIPIDVDSQKLLRGMNSLLPNDIRILKCEICSPDFNPNRDSKSKEYHYYFSTALTLNPLLYDTSSQVLPSMKNSEIGLIDIKEMERACKLFIGEHDFYNFATKDTSINSTTRNILNCELLKADFSNISHDLYYLKIKGDGFLKHMVRYISGAIFEVGRGRISLNDINKALINPNEKKLSPKTKSRGLHLIEIFY